MIIHTPWADDLRLAPELGILATLEATLATTIEMMVASHPEIGDGGFGPADGDGNDVDIDVAAALVLARLAAELVAAINRYRLALFNGFDLPLG
jgi:hypothetical protein